MLLQTWYGKLLLSLSASLPLLDIVWKFLVLILLIKIYKAINDNNLEK